MIRVGDRAPDFRLKASTGAEIALADYRGRQPVLLLFFPLAFSPVCTRELCSLRDDYARFQEMGAQILAVSVDSPFTLAAWAEQMKFPFPLLSDFNKEVARRYDALHDDLLGLRGVAKRSAFVIDREGIVRYAWVSDDPRALPDFDALSRALREAGARAAAG
jgi:peroxiredoxin